MAVQPTHLVPQTTLDHFAWAKQAQVHYGAPVATFQTAVAFRCTLPNTSLELPGPLAVPCAQYQLTLTATNAYVWENTINQAGQVLGASVKGLWR